MGKPLPWLSKQAPTSSSPEQPRSPAGRTVTATTSQSSVSAESSTPSHRLSWRTHGRDLIAAVADRSGHNVSRALYASSFWQRALNGPAPDRILVNPRCYYRKSIAEAEGVPQYAVSTNEHLASMVRAAHHPCAAEHDVARLGPNG